MPPAPATTDRHVVTAVLVAHDGVRWLPETLKALLTQSRPVQRMVAVDTGSRDRGPGVLAEVVTSGNLLELPRATGYGDAITAALRHPAASLPVPDDHPGEPRTEWVWLLHDDSAPAHDALERLLLRAAASGAAVLGPKLRDWYDRRLLLELGTTVDRAARRVTGVERGEFDQGQHDGVRDVLAVSSAGMLVRREVWDRLGGFDASFGLFRDDLDFCWRALAAGHRVVAVGDAVVHHAEAARRGDREIGAHTESPRRTDRRNALNALLGNLPWPVMVRALLRNLWTTLTRVLYLLAVKQPAAARAELGGFADVALHPLRLRRVRVARAQGRRHVYHSVRRHMARRVALRRLYEELSAHVAAHEAERRRDLDEDLEERRHSGRRALAATARWLSARPGVLLFLTLTAVALAAERSLVFAGSRLGGGALLPTGGGASDLWAQYWAGWHPAGLGSDDGSPPYVGALAAVSSLLFGKPWLAVSVLLLASVPLAGLAAYAAARPLVAEPSRTRRARSRCRVPLTAIRMWFAATYALLPAATGAIAGGRLGTAVVLVLLPLVGLAGARACGLPRRRDRRTEGRAAWTAALLLAVAMAFVPLVWPLALAAGALVGTLFRRSRRNLAIMLGVPPLLLGPWTLGLLRHPSRFLLEAGPHAAMVPLPDAADLLALSPGGPGTPARWATYGLLLAALCALPLRNRRTIVLAGWLLALFGLMTAVAVSAFTVVKGADEAPAWPGAALLFAACGLLLAATAAVRRAAESLAGTHLIYQVGGALVVLAALTAPGCAAVLWIVGGSGPLAKVSEATVPEFLAEPTGPRTLLLRSGPDGRVLYSVLRGGEPHLGETETPPDERARRRMDDLVAGLAGGRAGDEGQALTRMGVQYVLVARPAEERLTTVLDAAPELTRFSRTETFGTWRFQQPAGRLTLLGGAEPEPLAVDSVTARIRIPSAASLRTLLLAESADDGWHATLNGRELEPRPADGWAASYEIPASGGDFALKRDQRLRHTWVTVQGAAVLLVIILALPGAQPDRFTTSNGRRRARAAAGSLRRRITPRHGPGAVSTKPAEPAGPAGAAGRAADPAGPARNAGAAERAGVAGAAGLTRNAGPAGAVEPAGAAEAAGPGGTAGTTETAEESVGEWS
ncbi:glycosyltransferase family 2 protein [Actinomadura hibisca]|uniref:glycosyltransferase family 2 protein n=1 Tax=Actinomadura hibisca TaxID=68565 RepID=UPI0008315070|nr:glycosyltransferase family 2 protein [Actinomadura hibisca]